MAFWWGWLFWWGCYDLLLHNLL